MKKCLFLPALILLLSLAGIAQQQQDPPDPSAEAPDDQGFRIGIAVDQIFLSLSVRSVQGGFLKGLTREDFQVFEDGAPQEIVNFSSQKVPVHVVLLIDASGSTRYSQSEIRRAALGFAEQLTEEDRVAIITFNDLPRLILNWTNDLEKIKLGLESIYAKGSTVLNDAIFVTFDDLLGGVEGKKAVILLTDGVDTGSMVGFDEAIDLAIRSEALVYVVSKLEEYWASATAFRQQYRLRSMSIPRQLTDDYIVEVKRSLLRLADLTGGKVFNESDFRDLNDVYIQVAEELKNQYYLSYIPTNKTKDGNWRSISVRTSRPDAVVRTRTGYFAEGPEVSRR